MIAAVLETVAIGCGGGGDATSDGSGGAEADSAITSGNGGSAATTGSGGTAGAGGRAGASDAGRSDAPSGAGGSGGSAGTGAGDAGSGGSVGTGGSDGGACPAGMRLGANVHSGTSDPPLAAALMAARHLTTARMDLWGWDTSYVTTFRAAVSAFAAQGIAVETVVFDYYSGGQPGNADCSADLATVEARGYDDALTSVQRVDDLVHDFELQNEVPLYKDMQKAGTTGENADDFATPCGAMQAANLRGMARAIAHERSSSGRPLRIIVGTVDRRWGFFRYLQEQGVTFDVVGYHIYPWQEHAALDQDPWFGTGGPLGQLAAFNRPVHINEFNCGETYSGTGDYSGRADFENHAGQPVTEACFASIAKHLQEIANQTVANVESVHFYEILDEPAKAPPENRFGLLYDLSTPKVHLYLAAAFSGGALTSAEAAELTSRGLLTQAQIDAWSPCGAGH